jgi:hypothetical protein
MDTQERGSGGFAKGATDAGIYASLSPLPAAAFAWEFARRSPAYRDAWTQKGNHGDAAAWGLLALEDPGHDARAAMPLWQPQSNRHVLPLNGGTKQSGSLLLDTLQCRVRISSRDGHQHILFGHEGRFLQLDVLGNLGDGSAVTLQTRVLTSPCCLALHWRGLRQFADLMRYRAMRPKLYPAQTRAKRLLQMLQLLDIAETETSQRNMAVAMFGEDKVRREWGHGADHMRDWVRYSLRAARALSEKGYIKLLR